MFQEIGKKVMMEVVPSWIIIKKRPVLELGTENLGGGLETDEGLLNRT